MHKAKVEQLTTMNKLFRAKKAASQERVKPFKRKSRFKRYAKKMLDHSENDSKDDGSYRKRHQSFI